MSSNSWTITFDIPKINAYLLAIFPVLYLFHRSLYPKPLPGIPVAYPEGYTSLPWFTGFLTALNQHVSAKQSVAPFFEELGEKYGSVFQVPLGPAGTWLGRLTGMGTYIIGCTDIQEMEDACGRRGAIFAKGDQDLEPLRAAIPLGMVAIPAGDMHRHHRRVFGRSMTGAYLAKMIPRMEQCVDDLVKLWSLRMDIAARTGEVIHAKADFVGSTNDVIASITFGVTINSVAGAAQYLMDSPTQLTTCNSNPPLPKLSAAFDILVHQIAAVAFAPFPKFATFYYRNIAREFRAARKDVVDAVEASMASERERITAEGIEAGRKPTEADHVVGMVLEGELTDLAKGNKPLTHKEIVDESMTFLIGGSETTATGLSWTVKYFARLPQVQHKLHAEIVREISTLVTPGGSDPSSYVTLNDEARLPYLHAVTYECFRVSQIIGGTGRTTTADTTLLGYPLPARTKIFFLTSWATGQPGQKERDNSERHTVEGRRWSKLGERKYGWWHPENVKDFIPERWLTEEGVFNPKAGPWLPFGSGSRGCFGQKLAMLEFKIFLVKLVGTFFFEKVEKELDTDEVAELISRHPRECNMRLSKRKAE